MNSPLPEHHSNPETFKDEPVFIFEDDAIYPEPKDGASPAAGCDEARPPLTPPPAAPPGKEAQH